MTAKRIPVPQFDRKITQPRVIEIRLNPDGSMDEVCAPGFHLEQMSATHWWMCIESDRGSVHVNLHSKATIKANVDDERGKA